MKTLSALICLLTFFGSARAQDWVNKMLDQNVNFYEVQDAFNAHWQGKDYERGKGYKQFKRWENLMEPRLYPSGERVRSKVYVKAWNAIRKMESVRQKSGSSWHPLGPSNWVGLGWNPGLGRVNAITRHPSNSDIIFVCTPSGGLWKSTDAGDSWQVLTDNLPAIGASGLAIDYTNPDVMYLATGDGDGSDTYSFGVLKSVDGGATWETTSLIFDFDQEIRCSDIKISPDNPQKIWIATNNGLYATNDGAQSWDLKISGNIRDIEVKPGAGNVVYASGKRFYRSEDGGDTFVPITAGVPAPNAVNRLAIAVTPANPNLVYMVAGSNDDSGFHGLYRSSDAGVSFSLQSNTPNILTYSEIGDGEGGQSWYDLAITASPNDADRIFVGGINVWRSDNGGIDWNIVSHWVYPSSIGYTHADIHALEHFGDRLFCGSDGGVFSSPNDGQLWTDHSDGLQISQFYRIAISPQDTNLILAAAQDNGTNLFNGATYSHLLGGDGNAALIDYSNPQKMYSAYPGGDLQRSLNAGASFSEFDQGINESGAWVTPYRFHPTDPTILYAAYENVWRRNGESPWVKISNLPTSGTLTTLCVAPSDPNVIYTSTYSSLMKTSDGGVTWIGASGGLPNLAITSVEIHPDNPDEVWITTSGYTEGAKVYHSVNGGLSWENISLNLPNIPVNCIAYQLGSDDALYVGTDAGVFFKDNTYDNWTPFNEGLPNVIVNQILFQYQTAQVYIATFGRGVWKNDFFDVSNLEPVAAFSADQKRICAGDSIQFHNLSLNVSDDIWWSFDGGSPAQSTESNPVIGYAQPGTFNVKLVVSNPNGSDSLLYEGFIDVMDATGTLTPFTETFEAGDELDALGWFALNPDGNVGWEVYNDGGFESSNAVWLNNFSNTPFNTDALISGTYDLSALDTAFITMRVAYTPKPDETFETMKVFLSTDCGTTWNLKKTFTSVTDLPSAPPSAQPFTPADSTQWNLLTIDNIFPEERVSGVRMKLEFRSNGGNNIYVDNINITDAAPSVGISVAEKLFAEVKIYPNPAPATLAYLSMKLPRAKSVSAHLYDIHGRMIRTLFDGKFARGSHDIPFPLLELTKGPYTVVITSEDGSTARTLIVN